MSYDKETWNLIEDEWMKKKYPTVLRDLGINSKRITAVIGVGFSDDYKCVVAQILYEWGYVEW